MRPSGITCGNLALHVRIGGSIRSPAANQGLYGLKPTALRLPKGGCANPHLGSGNVIGVVGPLSTSLEGVKIFMKTVVDSKPWIEDPSLVPLPWRTGCFNQRATESKRLKIGVMGSDGIVTPHPPVTRAMQVMVNQLKKIEDVQIVEWKPYKHDLASELVVGSHACLH